MTYISYLDLIYELDHVNEFLRYLASIFDFLDMSTVKFSLEMQRSKRFLKLDIDSDLDVQGISFNMGRPRRPETAHNHRTPVLSFRSRTIINDLGSRCR